MRALTDSHLAARALLPVLQADGWQVVPPGPVNEGYSGTVYLYHGDDPTHRSLDLLAQRWQRLRDERTAPVGQGG